MNNTKPLHIVAFIDILGFKEFVKNNFESLVNKAIQELSAIYKDIALK